MYLNTIFSPTERAIMAELTRVGIMSECPDWQGAKKAACVIQEHLISGRKQHDIAYIPRVSIANVKRVISEAASGGGLALTRLADLFLLGIGLPELPEASAYLRTCAVQSDYDRDHLAQLLKSARFATRRIRMAYGDDYGYLMPAKYMGWLLHVRDYWLRSGARLSVDHAECEPVLLVYRSASLNGQFELVDGFTAFGEDVMPLSIGPHLLRRSCKVKKSFSDDRLRKFMHVGVLAVATLDRTALDEYDRPVTVSYALKQVSSLSDDLIADDLFEKRLKEYSVHRSETESLVTARSTIAAIQKALIVPDRVSVAFRTGVLAQVQLKINPFLSDDPEDTKGASVVRYTEEAEAVNKYSDEIYECLGGKQYTQYVAALTDMYTWTIRQDMYEKYLDQFAQTVTRKGPVTALRFHAVDMAAIDQSEVSPFSSKYSTVEGALRQYGFELASDVGTLTQTDSRCWAYTTTKGIRREAKPKKRRKIRR